MSEFYRPYSPTLPLSWLNYGNETRGVQYVSHTRVKQLVQWGCYRLNVQRIWICIYEGFERYLDDVAVFKSDWDDDSKWQKKLSFGMGFLGRKPKEHLSWAIVGVSFGKYIMLTMRGNQNQSLSGVSEAISNGLQNRFTTLTAGQGVNYSMFTSQSSTALTDIRNWRPANLGYWFSSSPRNGGENDQCWAIWWSRTWSPFLFVLFSPFFLRATSPRFKNG